MINDCVCFQFFDFLSEDLALLEKEANPKTKNQPQPHSWGLRLAVDRQGNGLTIPNAKSVRMGD